MKTTVIKVVAAVLVVILLVGGGLAWEGHKRFVRPGPSTQPVTMIIPKGSGTELVGHSLEAAGVVSSGLVFSLGVKLRHATLKAGEYLFPAGVSAEEAMRIIADGKVVIHKLTVAEGLTVRQVLDMVKEADFLAGPVTRKISEGWLLPETWHMTRDETRDEVLARMEKAMRQTVDVLWMARAPGLPLRSKEEALILASMVERETGVDRERARVAAVFYNRMAKHMRFQSDPTVIYGLSDGMGELDRGLTRDDLMTKHAWNTYVIDGLPATPIANPGRASLEAVLHPAKSDDLYFVADGTGGHAFARTLDEHNANVANWRKIEKAGKGGEARP
ncbi:endolytic transglycosylase MltG [Paramagnetospirillum kuznetsovii]|uniref:Endolytic murein transglycosylase n=1 Tax=Paramagnetospirillum kuznetsovii TaxID=2053833 RepID=A0A364NZ66_9PROT|nr:endolytic transglycosylase MltG [Paramagnetospirillum kuznetsovii]RAU22369.1 endolytic transglycosylase MltG [Paramagnetospirillum kuznetsovii]